MKIKVLCSKEKKCKVFRRLDNNKFLIDAYGSGRYYYYPADPKHINKYKRHDFNSRKKDHKLEYLFLEKTELLEQLCLDPNYKPYIEDLKKML